MTVHAVGLVDTNVVVAAVAESHEHHQPSLALFLDRPARSFAVAAHSYAEAYAVLTRPAVTAPFRWPAAEAWAALESVAAVTQLVGLTYGQTFDTVRDYANAGGVGSRLYDKLIGQVAVQYGLRCVLTWNLKHMNGLFPGLEAISPADYLRG